MAPGALLLEAQKEYEVQPAAPLQVLPAPEKLGVQTTASIIPW